MLMLSRNGRPEREIWTAAAGFFCAALLLRVAVAWAVGDFARVPESYREYLIAGQRLVQSGVFGSPFLPPEAPAMPSAVMPPVYTALTAGALWLFGGETPAAVAFLQIINALATSAAAAIAYCLGRRLGGRRCARVAGALVALNPMLIEYSAYVWDTALFTLGVAFTLWLVLRLEEAGPTLPRFLALGIWLGVLALLNPALTSAYPVLVLWPLLPRKMRPITPPIRHDAMVSVVSGKKESTLLPAFPAASVGGPSAWFGWSRVSLYCVAAVVGWVVAIGPWTLRNHAQFDRWFYIRCGLWHELWLGVCPEADTNPRAVFSKQFVLLNEEVMRRTMEVGDFGLFDEYGAKAREAVRENPARYLKLSAQRAVDYWAGTVRTHADAADLRWFPTSPLRLGTTVFMLAESLLAAAAVVVGWRNSAVRRLALCCVLFSLVYTLTHMMIRYRAPSEPMMALMVGMLFSKKQYTEQ